MHSSKLIPSPLNPHWLIPEGWEHILGTKIDYRLGNSVLHLLRVQFHQHARLADLTEWHTHPYHQMLYYQRGSGRLEVQKHTHELTEGTIFFMPAGRKHRFQSNAGENAVCLALDFSVNQSKSIELRGLPMHSEVAVLMSLLHAHEAKPFHLRAQDQRLVDGCIDQIVVENDKREVGFATMIQSLLLRLIGLSLRATQRATGFSEHFHHTEWRYHLVAERVGAIIRAHATREPELTLREVARLCGTSHNHLNRILKKQKSHTFHQMLLQHRLERARELLQEGKLNCTEAAFQSGFNDSNYFSRAFRKTYGYPPSELGKT